MLIEIIFLQELSKDLSSNPHQLPAKVILIQKIGFSTKKKKNSSWINLHHLYSIFIFIFFTFWKWTNLHISKKKKKKSASGLGTLGSYFLGCFKKKNQNQNFQFHERIQDSQIFPKKKKKSTIKSKGKRKIIKICSIPDKAKSRA